MSQSYFKEYIKKKKIYKKCNKILKMIKYKSVETFNYKFLHASSVFSYLDARVSWLPSNHVLTTLSTTLCVAALY